MKSLTRHLFNPKEFNPRTNKVKSRAFQPNKAPRMSSVEVTGLSEDSCWELGSEVVAAMRGEALLARADFTESALVEGLWFDRDDDPFERHGNVVGWAAGEGDRAREIRSLQRAAILADSTLKIYASESSA